MINKLPKRILSLSAPATLEMARKSGELVAKGINVVNMSLGEPDFNTPRGVKDAAIDAIERNYSKYSPITGLSSLKEAACVCSGDSWLEFLQRHKKIVGFKDIRT